MIQHHTLRVQQDPMLARFTLLNTIAAFGLAKRPDLAVLALRAARADGTWAPSDNGVANALLNALVSDPALLYEMCAGDDAAVLGLLVALLHSHTPSVSVHTPHGCAGMTSWWTLACSPTS